MSESNVPKPGDAFFETEWFTIDQEHLSQFAWSTYLDPEHVDLTASKNNPLGPTLIDGFMLLSLLMYFSFKHAPSWGEGGWGFNYGTNKVRFTSPVMLGERVQVTSTVVAVEERSNGTLLTTDNTMHVEGRDKPAMVAQWVILHSTASEVSSS